MCSFLVKCKRNQTLLLVLLFLIAFPLNRFLVLLHQFSEIQKRAQYVANVFFIEATSYTENLLLENRKLFSLAHT